MMRRAAATGLAAVLVFSPGCGGGTAPVERSGAGETARTPAPRKPVERVEGPAGRLRVDDGGNGIALPVLFVHGLAGDRTLWRFQLEHFRKTRRAIAVDLHGNGESAAAEASDFTIPSYVADLQAVADGLGLARFVLVGHSLGGAVASGYAAARSDRVAGLVLADPSGDNRRVPRGETEAMLRQMRPETYPRFMRKYFTDMMAGSDPAVQGHVLRVMRLTRREVVVETLRGGFAYSPVTALRSYPGPKLVIAGETNRGPYSLRTAVPDLPWHVMTGTGHWPMLDRPEEFNRILDDFLARADLAEAPE
jgi:pimeloyl-ACP methyl ester carboxylesterase